MTKENPFLPRLEEVKDRLLEEVGVLDELAVAYANQAEKIIETHHEITRLTSEALGWEINDRE